MSKQLKLTFIADTHHFSETLGNSGSAYEIRSATDQKCLAETGAIIDAAFKKISESDTDAVMIAGDLSDDGERVCHEEFIEKLKVLQKTKPVYVTVATHDWCCDENPRRYVGDMVYNDVPTVDHTELREMYRGFGLNKSTDEFITHLGTSSYKVEFPENVVLLVLIDDQDGEGASGFTNDHLEWIVKQIETETAAGKLVIGMEHHLLYEHISPLVTGGGTCCGKHKMYIEKFAAAGMRFMFVGHSHIQRIDKYTASNGNEMYEINVGSLVGYPAPIVNMTIDSDNIIIDTDHVESFNYHGKTCTSEYLKDHATNIITKILNSAEHDTKGDFAKYLMEFHMKQKDAQQLKCAFKVLSKFINRTSVYSVGNKIHILSFGKIFSKQDLEKLHDVRIIDVVKNSMLSVLDGAIEKHEKGSAYYNVISEFSDIPERVVKRLGIKNEKVKKMTGLFGVTMREVMTGGEIDNNHLKIKR